MKCAALAIFVATITFATAAFAATTVPAPTMPTDLETAWVKTYSKSCKKPNGVVIEVSTYGLRFGLREISPITENGDLVALYELYSEESIVTVKQVYGSWKKYDRAVEDDEGLAAVVSAVGLTPQEFQACAE